MPILHCSAAGKRNVWPCGYGGGGLGAGRVVIVRGSRQRVMLAFGGAQFMKEASLVMMAQ